MNRLDTIIDALEDAVHNFAGDDTESKCVEALAAARELRELKPVAWLDPLCKEGDLEIACLWENDVFTKPLYALDEVMK